MSYPLGPDSRGEHPIVDRWQADFAHRNVLQRQLLFLAALTDHRSFKVSLSRTPEGFDVVIRQFHRD